MNLPGFIVPRGEWVEKYPSTNGKIILGMRLAAAYVATLLVIVLVDVFRVIDVEHTPLEIAGWFIGGLLALNVAQFVGKRATWNPEAATLSAAREASPATATVATTTASVGAPEPPKGAAPLEDTPPADDPRRGLADDGEAL